jgi:CubicO group peptidase (beta-lactamase class C family)
MKILAHLFLAACLGVLGVTVYRFAMGPMPVVVELTPGPPQPRVTPEEAGIDPQAIAAAVEYAGARRTTALLIGHGGHLVFEKYWDGSTLDTEVELSGFTPVLSAIALGGAINDRLVAGIDVPVSLYLPDAGEEAGALTLRQLLARQGPDADEGAYANQLARILEKVDGKTYDRVIADRLWAPIGAGRFSLAKRDAGNGVATIRADCCLRARLGDWMRIGEILANDGVFEGNQFAPPRFVTEMLTPTHRASPNGFFTRVDGSFAARDVGRLESAGKQRLWVVPSLRLVILRVGADPGENWDEAMIPDSIARGTRGWEPTGAVDRNDPKSYAPH